MEALQNFYYRFTNNLSLTSMLVCLLTSTLVFCGHVFWYQYHSLDLLYGYFASTAAVMVVFAIPYGLYAENTSEFDGGFCSRPASCFHSSPWRQAHRFSGAAFRWAPCPDLSSGTISSGASPVDWAPWFCMLSSTESTSAQSATTVDLWW